MTISDQSIRGLLNSICWIYYKLVHGRLTIQIEFWWGCFRFFFFFCFPDVRYAGKKHAWAQNRSLCLHVTVKTTKNMDNNMKKGHQTDGKNSLDDVESNFEFESVSCFVFSKHSRLRQWTVQLLQWPYPFKTLANSCWSNTGDCVHFTFVVSFASHSRQTRRPVHPTNWIENIT